MLPDLGDLAALLRLEADDTDASDGAYDPGGRLLPTPKLGVLLNPTQGFSRFRC